ncbi:cell division protein FtsN [Neisseria subflava]|uniref:cell division protein FtsN n=1 Tax=Neisseria subflava TaxID=28449 RepID=UPI0020B725B2|nr:cell division protein FtsN [Neisseria subflava]UTG67595.1 cell division protein FtsN [Neisseria subflava]
MSDNKQKETPNGYDLDGYEQLKRRNRRRLVLASGLVVASGMLFGLALTSGDDKNSPFKEAPVGQSQVKTADEPSKAVVLEPNKEDVAAAEEAARHADAEAPNKPQNAGDEEDNAPVEVLKPSRESAPEDVGEPLVLINDTLDDGNIKGLEESERIQRAEAAKREAAERRAEERRQRQAEQRAAARKAQAQQEADEKENALAAKKRALQARAEKAEREAAAERNKLAQLEKAEKAIAERKSAKNNKNSVKDKAEPTKKAEAKVEKTKNEKAKPETAKAEKADKVKTAEKPSEKAKPKAEKETAEAKPAKKAAIQAGYAEKERAQSLQRKMKAAGIDSTITEVMTDKGKVYRVKSASYKNARDAERDLNKLRVHGIAGQVTSE